MTINTDKHGWVAVSKGQNVIRWTITVPLSLNSRGTPVTRHGFKFEKLTHYCCYHESLLLWTSCLAWGLTKNTSNASDKADTKSDFEPHVTTPSQLRWCALHVTREMSKHTQKEKKTGHLVHVTRTVTPRCFQLLIQTHSALFMSPPNCCFLFPAAARSLVTRSLAMLTAEKTASGA